VMDMTWLIAVVCAVSCVVGVLIFAVGLITGYRMGKGETL